MIWVGQDGHLVAGGTIMVLLSTSAAAEATA